MKKILRNIAIASVVATGFSVTSCEDLMTVDTGDKIYQNAQDTLYSYLGIMRAMQDIAERQVILGEIRGDLVSESDYTTDTLFAISNFDNPQDQSCSMLNVSDYYNVINNCNFYIQYADTSARRANSTYPYMLNEYAQVKAIRAWAYLQLVKNYRAVPFVTEPISDSESLKNFDYNANLVTKDDLVDRLIADGLANFVNLDYPQYGNPADAGRTWGLWETGAGNIDISARMCFIPIRVILGDLYLLRGASGDYEKAAKYYHEYLQTEPTPMAPQYTLLSVNNGRIIGHSSFNWGRWAASYSYDASSNEVISLIPSAANAAFGKVLTRVANIYGYNTTSSQANNTTTNDDGEESSNISGAISVKPTYKRQYGPSNAYMDIISKQNYVYTDKVGTNDSTFLQAHEDARYYFSVEEAYDDDSEIHALCCKAANGSTFYYTIPTYRKTLIWLRLAEAINRAGHPEFAFAILKDGLNRFTIPTIGKKEYIEKTNPTPEDIYQYQIVTIDDQAYYLKVNTSTTPNDTVYVVANEGEVPQNTNDRFTLVNGKLERYTRAISTSAWKWLMNSYTGIIFNTPYNPLEYVAENDRDTLRLHNFINFLDFSGTVWDNTYGIHAKGGGYSIPSNIYTSYKMTAISGNYDRFNSYSYKTMLEKYGVDPSTATRNDIINAVENIIVDELALETAFEGNRFTDLVRIAEHKNASGYDGTEWLAQKIANRGSKAAVENTPAIDGFNASLYSKLKNTNNWYFALPAWNVK